MRVENNKTQFSNSKFQKKSQQNLHPRESLKLPQEKVELSQTKKHYPKVEHFRVGDNNPDRPLVSTKILDSLNTGMIKFNQKERDTIAKILGNRAQAVRNK